MFSRYALYYTPPAGPLSRFAAAWFGQDPATGRPGAAPDTGLSALVGQVWVGCDPDNADLASITARPGKYGFHATLKAPFRLAPGVALEDLASAVAAFAAGRAPVSVDGLVLDHLRQGGPCGFLALMPDGECTALTALAGEIVMQFDRFRAPLTEAEIARRQPKSLSERQRGHLAEWGYPFVLDEFRFHMTLTDSLPLPVVARLRAALAPHLGPLLPRPFVIDAISLMGETDDRTFQVIRRHDLAG